MKTSEKADTSSKHKTTIADVNAVKHEATTAEANAKVEGDNAILHQLLKTCSTFKIKFISYHTFSSPVSVLFLTQPYKNCVLDVISRSEKKNLHFTPA